MSVGEVVLEQEVVESFLTATLLLLPTLGLLEIVGLLKNSICPVAELLLATVAVLLNRNFAFGGCEKSPDIENTPPGSLQVCDKSHQLVEL